MDTVVRATTESSQKTAAPPLVSEAGKKMKLFLEGPAISMASELSMVDNFVSCRQRMEHLAAAASSATADRRAGMLRPRGFQVTMGHRASLIDEQSKNSVGLA
jgi:hypothetical protein